MMMFKDILTFLGRYTLVTNGRTYEPAIILEKLRYQSFTKLSIIKVWTVGFVRFDSYQGGGGYLIVIYTGTQSFITTFSYSLAWLLLLNLMVGSIVLSIQVTVHYRIITVEFLS